MISSYLNQTATRKAQTSVDQFGKVTTDSGTDFKCRAQGSKSKVINADGQEVTADLEMWIKPTQEMKANDKVVLEGKTYSVNKIQDKRNLSGRTNHKKLLLLESKE